MQRAVTTFAFLFVCLACAPHVRAEASESSEYKEAVTLGLAEFEEKNFLEARVQFARAHSLDPSARTLRALGMVNFELKEYAASVRYLSEALASNDRPLDAQKRESVQKLLERAQSNVARISIDVEPTAQLVLDGMPVRFPDSKQLMLDIGDHILELKADGYISERRTIKVQGGETEVLRVRLIAVAAATSRAPGDDTPSERRPVYKSPWLWIAVGVVVAGAAAGTAIALTRKNDEHTADPYLGQDGVPAIMGLSR
jgi:tetratricopeptide (TPR) repeat protein